jgi:hypothetical protein
LAGYEFIGCEPLLEAVRHILGVLEKVAEIAFFSLGWRLGRCITTNGEYIEQKNNLTSKAFINNCRISGLITWEDILDIYQVVILLLVVIYNGFSERKVPSLLRGFGCLSFQGFTVLLRGR